MPEAIQLLKHIRNAVTQSDPVNGDQSYKSLLPAIDCMLNQIMLLDSPGFYLDYILRGKALLGEGQLLVEDKSVALSEQQVLRNDLNADFRTDIIYKEINKLHENIAAIVILLDEGSSANVKSFLERVTDWEKSLYEHDLEQAASSPEIKATPITAVALEHYLATKYPDWKDLKVTTCISLDGGFSKKTVLFETHDEVNGHQSMVIRAEQAVDLLGYKGSDVTQEYNTIQLMRRAGLPIAEPLWLEADHRPLGTRFIVSRKAIGKTYGGNLGNTEMLSDELPRSIISTFIQMHNIRLDTTDPLLEESHLKEWVSLKTVSEATRYAVSEFLPRSMRLTDITASPQLMRGLKWLERNVPDVDEPPVIVHQDFSFNNLIIDNNRITAVLDWESSILGDPALDIVWTQFSLREYVSMPEFLSLYKLGTGRTISEYRLAYAQVAKLAFIVISCLGAMRAIDKYESAHINISIMAYKYMGLFGTTFNQLIADAEAAKGR